MPLQIIASDTGDQVSQPVLPFTAFGYVFLDDQLIVDGDYSIHAYVDFTDYGHGTVFNGSYMVDVLFDDLGTPIKDGGLPGDTIRYQLKPEGQGYGKRCFWAEETSMYVLGDFEELNLHFSSQNCPWPLGISGIVPNPRSGNDRVTISNPGNDTAYLDNWKLADNDAWELSLAGMEVGPYSQLDIDLGGDVLSNDEGDEIALCWQIPAGTRAGGDWMPYDLVEYGEAQSLDNSVQPDYPDVPAQGIVLERNVVIVDDDDCSQDFHEVPAPLAPILPWNIYGQVYIDGSLPSTTDYLLMTLINDTVFGTFRPVAGGWYDIDTYGDHTDTPDVREGGGNGDMVYYLMKKDDGVPGRRWMCAAETFTFVSGGFQYVDLHFSTVGSPWPLKISSLTPSPTSGNDAVTLYNPGTESVTLDDWLLRDRDGMTLPLTGRTILAGGEITVDLGGDVLSSPADGGISSGDELALCWRDPLGVMGDGEWMAMDQVEYGNQNDYYDNTTLWDYPSAPGIGEKLVRFPAPGTDTDNCTLDFTVEAPELDSVDIPLETGWNLVSLPIMPQNISAGNVLASVFDSCVVALAYDPYDPADPWKSWRPEASSNDMYVVDERRGLWINVDEPSTLHVEGTFPTTSFTYLKAGWNLVGFPASRSLTVNEALAGTGFDRPVECYDVGAPYMLRQMGDSELMNPGEGYWVHVPADVIWTLDY